MLNKISYLHISFTTLILITGCTYDSTDDLIVSQSNGTITYNQNIKSIIDNNCISCHGYVPSNGATFSLTNYQNVKDAVINKNLIDRISRSEGASGAMPLGGPRLPNSSINLIIQWKNQGYQQ
jgi:uncharacterized membrane protein